jgi:plasmid stability protein
MPATNPRLNVVLDRELQKDLRLAAKRRGKSLSAVAADLLRDALERDEDMMLARLADKREKSVKRWHSHDDVWKKFG